MDKKSKYLFAGTLIWGLSNLAAYYMQRNRLGKVISDKDLIIKAKEEHITNLQIVNRRSWKSEDDCRVKNGELQAEIETLRAQLNQQ